MVERGTVGVGNRCKPAETARDIVGVDKKHDKGNGPSQEAHQQLTRPVG